VEALRRSPQRKSARNSGRPEAWALEHKVPEEVTAFLKGSVSGSHGWTTKLTGNFHKKGKDEGCVPRDRFYKGRDMIPSVFSKEACCIQ